MTGSSSYEPDERAVEREANRLEEAAMSTAERYHFGLSREQYREQARHVLTERHAREQVLREAIARACYELGTATLGVVSVSASRVAGVNVVLAKALAAHAALDAPSEPTLREAVEAMSDALKVGHVVDVDGVTCVLVQRGPYNHAMQALARERGK